MVAKARVSVLGEAKTTFFSPELWRQDWLFNLSACCPTDLMYNQQGEYKLLKAPGQKLYAVGTARIWRRDF